MRLQVESEEARGAEGDGGGRERQAKRRAERGGGGRHLAARHRGAHHRVRTHAHARLSSRQKKECRNAQKTRGAGRVRRWDG